eukprot:4022717-Prymnesium_polylepis.1
MGTWMTGDSINWWTANSGLEWCMMRVWPCGVVGVRWGQLVRIAWVLRERMSSGNSLKGAVGAPRTCRTSTCELVS